MALYSCHTFNPSSIFFENRCIMCDWHHFLPWLETYDLQLPSTNETYILVYIYIYIHIFRYRVLYGASISNFTINVCAYNNTVTLLKKSCISIKKQRNQSGDVFEQRMEINMKLGKRSSLALSYTNFVYGEMHIVGTLGLRDKIKGL